MDFPVIGRSRREVKELKQRLETRERDVARLVKVQELLVKDILTLQEVTEKNVGNDYKDYATAVAEISDKYNGKASWGCFQTGEIIDLRAAFIIGEGIKIVHTTKTRAEARAELDWANAFLEYNALDSEMAQELAKEAEIEGKIGLELAWDKDPWRAFPGMVSVRFVSWTANKYTITADPKDYLWYKEMAWTPTGSDKPVKLSEPDFVYKKFGGRLNKPNDAQPKVMKCLTQIDRLDQALFDLRKINHLYSAPTPELECETAEHVRMMDEAFTATDKGGQNWKMGKFIIHTGKFNIKGVDTSGVANLISEIELLVKMISGSTGIPIHFLGLLDLLRNRATGDNTRELIHAATSKERQIWEGAFNETLEKAMASYNLKTGQDKKSTKLDPTKIMAELPIITQEQWDRIRDVLIPAALGDIISKEHVAGQIPGVDAEDEAEKKAGREESELERVKAELERSREEARLNPKPAPGQEQPKELEA
jgi:hypothetical protein